MKLLLSLSFLLISFCASAQNIGIEQWMATFLKDETIKNAPISICVQDLSTSTTLLDVNQELSLTPASVLKILTTATAFEVLGKDYRFETVLSYRGHLKNGTLTGDLIIHGGGDPSLGSDFVFGKSKRNFYTNWVAAIREAGIDTIIGNIVADPSIYADQDVPQTWIWEDLGNYYGAAAQGISLYDNTFKLVFKTENMDGGTTKIIRTEPFIPNLELQNEVRSSNDLRDRSIVFGSPYDNFRIVKGTLAKGREELKIRASIPDPALLLAYELKQELSASGIMVSGQIQKEHSDHILHSASDSILLKWPSPPLFEIIQQLNFFSINLFAEHLCKHLGLIVNGEGSSQAGLEVIQNFWEKEALNTDFLFLADGSGLSRSNAISAKLLVDILNYMHHDTVYATYFANTLPLAGLEGTQQYYFQKSFLKGNAQIKSGSMTRVRSFAGYMNTNKNTPIAFAIIINNFNDGSFPMAQKLEELIEEIFLYY